MLLTIYSKIGTDLFVTDNFRYTGSFMGDRTITLNVESPTPISFAPDDYVDFRSERFLLYYTPTAKKIASQGARGDSFVYDLVFVPRAFELKKCAFLDFVASDNNLHYTGLPAVAFTGEVRVLAERIKANLDRLYTSTSAWTINVDTDASDKIQNISLTDSYCWDALMQVSTIYGLFFSVRGRVITIGISGTVHAYHFEYGTGNGLYELTRVARSTEPVITRLKCYGSNRNIPLGYKHGEGSILPDAMYIPSLMLPDFETTGIDYLQSGNTSIYGIREGIFRDETIYPSIEGLTGEYILEAGGETISSGPVDVILATDLITDPLQTDFSFIIPDIGFDINDYLGAGPAIEITSGALGGVKLEIVSVTAYEVGATTEMGYGSNSGWKVTCNRNNDSGFYLPDENTFLDAGDHFVITGILMPDLYVKAAEARLHDLGEAFLADNDHSRFTYSLGIDEIFMADNALKDTLFEGDRMHIEDADVGVDESIIAQQLSITFGGLLPKYEITLSDKPLNTALEQVRRGLAENIQQSTIIMTEAEKQQRKTDIAEAALVNTLFDPTTGKLKPNILDTNVDALLQAENDVTSGLLDGYILWQHGLTYWATDINYKILGERYMSHKQEITLDAADATWPRIDTFYVDTFSNLHFAKGTPSATPEPPTLTGTQLQVMSVMIMAGATTPYGLDVEWVYLENTSPDWAASSTTDSNVSVNFASTDAPATGTKRIRMKVDVPDSVRSVPLHKIGERYQGGIIFWLNAGGKSGLIAQEYDQPETQMFWSRLSGGNPYSTGATNSYMMAGSTNTNLMLANDRAKDQAIKYCVLPKNGYSDWVMPSLDALKEMFTRRLEIGNFGDKTYWSSTEGSWEKAACLAFSSGASYYRLKNNNYSIRPVRAFDDSSIPTGVEVPAVELTNTEITFTSPTPVSVKNGVLSFNMKSSLDWKPSSTIIITSVLNNTNTGIVAIKPKYLMGFNPSNPAWQQVVVPMYKFQGDTKTTIDKFRFNFKSEWPNTVDIGFDDIRYQHTTIDNLIIRERLYRTDYRFEELPDSEMTIFTTLAPYIEGTVELYINGKKQTINVDYWEEDDKIRIKYVLNEACGLMINYFTWKA